MFTKQTVLIAAVAGMLSLTASAQITGYSNGSILMGFNATGGQGDTLALTVSLGLATTYRDATSPVLNIVNIGSLLSTSYGSNWYDRADLFFGLGTVFSNTSPGIDPTLVNGDPGRTVYLSRARPGAANELLANSTINNANATTIGNSSNNFISLQGRFESNGGPATLTNSIGGATAFDESLLNTWEEFTPFSGTQFSFVSQPGVVQSFGTGTGAGNTGPLGTFSVGSVEGALDFYRYQATNSIAGQYGFGQSNFVGGFEGIFTIDTSGNVSFTPPVPEPSSALLFGISAVLFGAGRRRFGKV